MNEKAKQNYANNRQQQSTQKLFRDFLENNQDLPNQKAPTTYVSPHRNHYQNQSRSPHNARYHTSHPNLITAHHTILNLLKDHLITIARILHILKMILIFLITILIY